MAELVLHAELRDGNDTVRAFNLSEADVRERFVAPLLGGRVFVLNDKEFDPRHARLTVLEGRRLGPGQLGLGGMGWSTALKGGTEVTGRFVGSTTGGARAAGSPAVSVMAGPAVGAGPVDRLRERLLGRLAAGPLALGDAVALSADLLAGHRVSERLALTETVVWELLHGGSIALRGDGGDATQPLASDAWAAVLLDPSAWRLDGPAAPVISATA